MTCTRNHSYNGLKRTLMPITDLVYLLSAEACKEIGEMLFNGFNMSPKTKTNALESSIVTIICKINNKLLWTTQAYVNVFETPTWNDKFSFTHCFWCVNCHLIAEDGFVLSSNPKSYVDKGNLLTIGSPKSNWSWVRSLCSIINQWSSVPCLGTGLPGILPCHQAQDRGLRVNVCWSSLSSWGLARISLKNLSGFILLWDHHSQEGRSCRGMEFW